MKKWLSDNKVVVIGVLTAIALAVSELVKGGEASVKMLVFSGLIAGASWIARNLRGQWATIIGLFGNGLAAYLTMQTEGHVSYAQLVLQFVISLLSVMSAPAKSIGYEQTKTISDAELKGEKNVTTLASPNPPTKP